MKSVYMFNDALYDVVLNQLAQLEEFGEHYEEPVYKEKELTPWDLNTLVYILEMDISHMERELRQFPDRKPLAKVLESEKNLLTKIKDLMD